MHKRLLLTLAFAIAAATGAQAAVPVFKATCPDGPSVRTEAGDKVFLNDKPAQLKVLNPSQFEVFRTNVNVAVTTTPDGALQISYKRKNGDNGVCTVEK